jgi:dipeptidyl aminopeptidase/acylaminoacyl peptidase
MTKRSLVLLWSCIMMASCRVETNVLVVLTVTNIPTVFPMGSPTSTLTLTKAGTSTISPEAMSYQCLEITDHPPSDYVLKGTIVFSNSDDTDAFFWKNDTKNVYRFPREDGDRLSDFDVSPDRKHIVYLHTSKTQDKLVIATADGHPIWSQIRVTDSYYWNWFDNERLIGSVIPHNGTPSLFLLNPFTGKRQELRVDYPDSKLFSDDPTGQSFHWRFRNGGLPVYDPTLTRALYPECNSQCQDQLIRGNGGVPIALWDVETNQVIARIMTMDDYGDTPVWTSDGKQFIIATNISTDKSHFYGSEFFAMSRDGELKQLTHFMDSHEVVNISNSYSLSPNGKLLAFWIWTVPSRYEDTRLAVLNIETGQVINYCIQSYGSVYPIWSPDGTQLLVFVQDVQAQSIPRAVLIDLLGNYAAQIAEADYLVPVGWMVSP